MNRLLPVVALMSVVCFSSCDEQTEFDTPIIPVVAPDLYVFDNVNYDGQRTRLNQLDEMMTYIETGNQKGVALDVDVMQAMFENTNGNANGNFTFSSVKQLKDQCFELDQSIVEGYFQAVSDVSFTDQSAWNGQAGRVSSSTGENYRMFDENGWEYAEMIEKTIMGAVFYYRATSVYWTDEGMEVDNEEIIAGEGTAMEHHWDEAYGYFGASDSFPNEVEKARYWAKYCNRRDPYLATNTSMGLAFRKGRQAIKVQRYDVRDEAMETVKMEWERVIAGSAVHYINESIANMSDDYTRNHTLSEAYAMVNCLFYNVDRSISLNEINAIKADIGTNFYEVTLEGLQAARDKLAEIYDMNGAKTLL